MRFFRTVCIAVLLINSAVFANQPKITLATSSWEPYVSDDPAYHGYVYDIVQAAYTAAGYEVDIQFMPFDKAIQAAQSGLVDGYFPEYLSRDHANGMAFTKPFSASPIVFYKMNNRDIQVPRDTIEHTLQALKHYRFGVVRGYTNFPAFDQNSQLKKIEVASDKENIEQLFRGKVDLIIIDQHTAEYLLKNDFPWNYQIKMSALTPPVAHAPLFVAIRGTSPRKEILINAFNQGLNQIEKNGTLSQIIDRDASNNGEEIA